MSTRWIVTPRAANAAIALRKNVDAVSVVSSGVASVNSREDSWVHGVHVSTRSVKDGTAIIRASYEWMDAFIPELNVETTLFDYDDVEPEKEAELRELCLVMRLPSRRRARRTAPAAIPPGHGPDPAASKWTARMAPRPGTFPQCPTRRAGQRFPWTGHSLSSDNPAYRGERSNWTSWGAGRIGGVESPSPAVKSSSRPNVPPSSFSSRGSIGTPMM